ncbi:putative solute symporter protein [Deinococcus proteolyticus MRP]|uniref:Putative solute symporter protein n=1 Tax=Deinococcus proteolyticus (strain ATCC 35074 / DSM 20540 / JCM 6276 / NBRC 101906 / NCIMB 13154 / VKM Ac-1939 / CCM 2703 / MRP) TaxID=693977 RepID=F0RJN7_DEIPM|nr:MULTISPECIES: DUF4212 domain-containing protein [Deinococcus]ADY26607.1 putative solute symporter protein [Deinococcus proteolyticus MRP]MCY1702733.1 DUF4212 domain-containing protein [Deinococcus sp. SL84]
MTHTPLPPGTPAAEHRRRQQYWQATLRLTLGLLAVWLFVSIGLGVLLAPALDRFQILGGPLGFWIGHNGAIYVFIALIAIYASRMAALDRQFGVGD